MEFIVYKDVNAFDELEAEWNELLRCSMSNMIFLTWEWQSTWWDAYEPGQLWVIACRDTDGQLLGIAPMFIEQHETQGRVVRFIGSEDVTDYLDVIIHKDYVDIVYNCLAEFLYDNRADYDLLDLVNISENSHTYTMLTHVLQERGFATEVSECEVSPVIKLPDSWDDYLSNLDKKQRHEIRRKLRRMNGLDRPVEWHIVDPTSRIESELELFFSLMAASDPEKETFLQNPRNVNFFKQFVEIAHEQGWLQLSFLRIGNDPVAAYISYDYNNRVLLYNSGQNRDMYAKLSTGVVLLAYLIEHAIKQGRDIFDFLRGDEVYKYRMGGQDTTLYQLQARFAVEN